MSQQVQFAPEASAELEDAARWYDQRHASLGLAFLAAVEVNRIPCAVAANRSADRRAA